MLTATLLGYHAEADLPAFADVRTPVIHGHLRKNVIAPM
jgi:hypothetical protein